MRPLYFLFLKMDIQSGGHLAQVRLMDAASTLVPFEAVTYEERDNGVPFLDQLLPELQADTGIFFIHWGPHVPGLLQRLKERNVVYVSYSTGYGFDIPPEVPILAGSLHTQAYWGRHASNSPIYHVPCIITDQFRNRDLPRPIDVMVQKRKNSPYVLTELVPRLQAQCAVTVLDDWVEDLALTFNQSKVYLYDSTAHWVGHQLSEGFGLPPLEALACGCSVFSSLNDALSDYLDPSFNCHQLHVHSLQYDVERITRAVREWTPPNASHDPVADYRKPKVQERLGRILVELNEFFDYRRRHPNSETLKDQSLQEVTPIPAAGIPSSALRNRIARLLNRLRNLSTK